MKLEKIALDNVRNFEHHELSLEDGINEIRMPNKGGKTTIADAVSFLLTGKLYDGSQNPESLKAIKDTSLPVEVEADFDDVLLKKTYEEKWVQTRGTTDVELKGHTNTPAIDGDKVRVSDFDQKLCELFNVDNLVDIAIMSNPYFFSQHLSWQDRLKYINRVIGEVKPKDVFDVKPVTNALKEDLEKKGIEKLAKNLKASIKDVKKDIADLKAMIKGDTIEDPVSEVDFKKAKAAIAENMDAITSLQTKKKGMKNPVLDELKEKLQSLKNQLSESKADDQQELSRINEKVNKDIESLRDEYDDLKETRNELENKIERAEDEIRTKEQSVRKLKSQTVSKDAQLSAKKNEWYEENGKEFEPRESKLCPNCGFDLAAEDNEEREEEFNQRKAEALRKINNQGKELKAEKQKLEKEIEELKADIDETKQVVVSFKEDYEPIVEKMEELESKMQAKKNEKQYVYVSEATKALKEQIETVETSIVEEKNKSVDRDGIEEEISELRQDNEDHQAVVDKFNSEKVLRQRKAKREKELGNLMEEKADKEEKMDILTLYKETYLKILKQRVENAFGDIKIQLIEENIKADSWNETCRIMVEVEGGLVPYETANTESKIRIGVKLADRLAEHLGWNKAPMFIDNGEAITPSNRVFETDAQIVYFIADESSVSKVNTSEKQARQTQLEV